jgi:hypothetical protein
MSMTGNRSQLYRLIEERIDGTLADFVAQRRRVDGPPFRSPTSWRDIAAQLTALTGIDANHETLRLWFGTEAEVAEPTTGGAR